jgi:hypothetical protein
MIAKVSGVTKVKASTFFHEHGRDGHACVLGILDVRAGKPEPLRAAW